MLQLKDLWGRTVGEKVTGRDGKILEELEGPRDGRAWLTWATKKLVDLTKAIISYWYCMSRVIYKSFEC